jgi:excisionase family DNA binding protein
LSGITNTRQIPRLLTAKEVEELIKIDVKTLYSYVQRGLIPYVKIQSSVRFPEEEIVAWLEQHVFRPSAIRRPVKAKLLKRRTSDSDL